MAELTNTSRPQGSHVPISARRITLIKGQQRWRFRWEAGDEPAMVQHVASLARDPRADFDWFDAAMVVRQINATEPGAS